MVAHIRLFSIWAGGTIIALLSHFPRIIAMLYRLFAIAIVCSCFLNYVHAQDDAAAGLKALDHFVGSWQTAATDKPSKWMPDGAKHTDFEHTAWVA